MRSADDWAEKLDEFSADLDLFLTLMTAIGVVIAVLSIVNTMLMSVTERRTEFGVLAGERLVAGTHPAAGDVRERSAGRGRRRFRCV